MATAGLNPESAGQVKYNSGEGLVGMGTGHIHVKPRLIEKLKRFGLLGANSTLKIKENIQELLKTIEPKIN